MTDKDKESVDEMERAVKNLLYEYQHTKIVQFLMKWFKQERRYAFRNGIIVGFLIGLALDTVTTLIVLAFR